MDKVAALKQALEVEKKKTLELQEQLKLKDMENELYVSKI